MAKHVDAEFWHSKWASNQIGFHEALPHPLLLRHWPSLALPAAARVFVPLCGKSNDMRWLRAQRCEVVAVELSEIAVAAFFTEQGLAAHIDRSGLLTRYTAPGYTLFCGDYFALDAALLSNIDAVYDRAALIALPPTVRDKYAGRLAQLTPLARAALVITVAYPDQDIAPPPFVVSDDEVAASFSADWSVQLLGRTAAEVKGRPALESSFQLTRIPADARR